MDVFTACFKQRIAHIPANGDDAHAKPAGMYSRQVSGECQCAYAQQNPTGKTTPRNQIKVAAITYFW